MKKLLVILIIAVLALILSACGADDEAYENNTEYFLQDLDYMLHVLENNFALFDVAYWARGVDIPAIVENIRAEIMANPNMDADGFYHTLVRNFAPLFAIGHFWIISPYSHYQRISDPGRPSFRTGDRLTYPHVLAFYEPRHPAPSDDEGDPFYSIIWTDRIIQDFADRACLFGESELAKGFIEAMSVGDYETARQLSLNFLEILDNTPNVRTEVLVDDSVGYLSIDSFVWGDSIAEWTDLKAMQRDEELILDFFEEIRDFDHLIIDLRRNGGGDSQFFTDAVIGPNIDRQLLVYGYAFMSRGEYSSMFIGPGNIIGNILNNMHGLSVRDNVFRPIYQMLDDIDLPYLNMDDMERMDYGFRMRASVNPRRLPQFNHQPAFDGKIWLLTSSYMGSAAQIAALITDYIGFATLVGETTGGNYGGPRIFVALPNTGILFQMDVMYITDSRGRLLEAGTIPHHFNMDGMDALETTLALIKEGQY
ncbi:MAG: S41 family peptidase [Defluviitaleaceae bacterium]|nr:S41 family peptidase [Defluviitaleaceae bacterium]